MKYDNTYQPWACPIFILRISHYPAISKTDTLTVVWNRGILQLLTIKWLFCYWVVCHNMLKEIWEPMNPYYWFKKPENPGVAPIPNSMLMWIMFIIMSPLSCDLRGKWVLLLWEIPPQGVITTCQTVPAPRNRADSKWMEQNSLIFPFIFT